MLTSGVRLGDLTLLPRRQLIGADGPLAIGRRALDILSVLAEAGGALVTKDELMHAVWPDVIVEENAIQVHVAALRKALGAEAGRLVTVRGLGYRLELSRAGEPAALPVTPSPVGPRTSVAVMPFANLTGDPSKDYLGEGMAEELIATLSRAASLKVPARSSSFAYKGRDVDIRRIASDLGVETVLEGSVRAVGERVRMTAQLIDAETGFHLWSESYDRKLHDLFDLQDEIAGAIARELKAKLGVEARRPVDPEAYHLYLQAVALAARSTSGDLPRAIGLFDAAMARDPSFAAVGAHQAAALLLASTTGVLPLAARAAARARAEQALALDPTLATAQMVLGGLGGLAGRWLDADAAFRAVQALAPGEAMTYRMMAYYVLAPCGRLEQAQAQARRGFELAPAEPLHSLGLATMAGLRGEDTQIVMHHLQTAMLLGLSIEYPVIRLFLAEAAGLAGRSDEAAEHMAMALPPPLVDADGVEVARLVYRARAGEGDEAEASAAVGRLLDATDADDLLWRYQVGPGILMNWQVKLGALDAAFAAADRFIVARERSGQLATMGLFQMWLGEMRPFRQDPRFQTFAQRLGMFAYWAEHGPPDGHRIVDGRLAVED